MKAVGTFAILVERLLSTLKQARSLVIGEEGLHWYAGFGIWTRSGRQRVPEWDTVRVQVILRRLRVGA